MAESVINGQLSMEVKCSWLSTARSGNAPIRIFQSGSHYRTPMSDEAVRVGRRGARANLERRGDAHGPGGQVAVHLGQLKSVKNIIPLELVPPTVLLH